MLHFSARSFVDRKILTPHGPHGAVPRRTFYFVCRDGGFNHNCSRHDDALARQLPPPRCRPLASNEADGQAIGAPAGDEDLGQAIGLSPPLVPLLPHVVEHGL
jgi:hypothetical protein